MDPWSSRARPRSCIGYLLLGSRQPETQCPTDARQAGQRELASSLKKLRKPSVGAWLANLLVLEQSNDVAASGRLGCRAASAETTSSKESRFEGPRRRRATSSPSWYETQGQKLLERASRCQRPHAEELEATLEAAFADPKAAESLLGGRLSSGLHYSGLGLGEQAGAGSTTGPKGSSFCAAALTTKAESNRRRAQRRESAARSRTG